MREELKVDLLAFAAVAAAPIPAMNMTLAQPAARAVTPKAGEEPEWHCHRGANGTQFLLVSTRS